MESVGDTPAIRFSEVRRPKCSICDDWLIFAADDKPSVEGHNEGIDAAINFLHKVEQAR